jgi:hypothetical protein
MGSRRDADAWKARDAGRHFGAEDASDVGESNWRVGRHSSLDDSMSRWLAWCCTFVPHRSELQRKERSLRTSQGRPTLSGRAGQGSKH